MTPDGFGVAPGVVGHGLDVLVRRVVGEHGAHGVAQGVLVGRERELHAGTLPSDDPGEPVASNTRGVGTADEGIR